MQKERDVAQPGRVRVWGACGRKFESCHPDLRRRLKVTHFQPLFFFIRQNKNRAIDVLVDFKSKP